MPVLFFDVGATLADVRVAADGSLTFVPRPRVLAVLDAFREVRKGIMSDPGPGAGAAARAASALHDAFPGHFTDDRLVHWGPKNGPGVFERAVAATAGEDTPAAAPDACVFVGEDPLERAFAARAGLRTAPHPVFTLAAVEGRPVFRARIALPADRALPALERAMDDTEAAALPAAPDRPVPALATARGAEALRRAGYTVDLHGPVGTPEPLEQGSRTTEVNKWAAGLGVPIAVLPCVADALAAHPAYRDSLTRLRGMGVRIGDPYERGGRPEFGWERALDLLG